MASAASAWTTQELLIILMILIYLFFRIKRPKREMLVAIPLMVATYFVTGIIVAGFFRITVARDYPYFLGIGG
jgi:energy-coupling factor transporter transmembrane protein EcfT